MRVDLDDAEDRGIATLQVSDTRGTAAGWSIMVWTPSVVFASDQRALPAAVHGAPLATGAADTSMDVTTTPLESAWRLTVNAGSGNGQYMTGLAFTVPDRPHARRLPRQFAVSVIASP